MNTLKSTFSLVVAGTATLMMTATANSHQVERGDCALDQAVAVSLACSSDAAAQRAVARCGSGCCDQAALRQQAVAKCEDAARAKNFNSSRSNRGSVVAPDQGGAATKADSKRSRDGFEDDGSSQRGRKGRNPQTGKEIKIPPVDDDSDGDGLADAEEKTDDGDDGGIR